MHYVIIGAGPAGITAAETLRSQDSNAEITVIGDEQEPPYSRMAIPYLLVKQIEEKGTYLRQSDNYYKNQAITLLQKKVQRLNPAQKTVCLENNQEIYYDKLLIATGSRPVMPPITGIDSNNIYHCWTLEDARKIAESVKAEKRVVLMGAGFIGCIILEALFNCGAQLTVVEMADRMVPRMMNDKASALIKQWCRAKGIRVLTDTRITAIEESGIELKLSRNNGDSIVADCIVSATGVKPNIDFLLETELEIDQGILVDTRLQTSVPDIYAAGDVAQALDFSTGEKQVQAIQPTATEHGVLAAQNMAGAKQARHYGSINMNVLDTLGLIASSFGLWMGVNGGDSVERYNPERFQYINLQFQQDILIGATTVGLTQHVGVLRGLIQGKIRLADWKPQLMQDPTRIMEAYLACTQVIK